MYEGPEPWPLPSAGDPPQGVLMTTVFERCRCDQWGRCLTDCPSADRTDAPGVAWYWNRRLNEWVWHGVADLFQQAVS